MSKSKLTDVDHSLSAILIGREKAVEINIGHVFKGTGWVSRTVYSINIGVMLIAKFYVLLGGVGCTENRSITRLWF